MEKLINFLWRFWKYVSQLNKVCYDFRGGVYCGKFRKCGINENLTLLVEILIANSDWVSDLWLQDSADLALDKKSVLLHMQSVNTF